MTIRELMSCNLEDFHLLHTDEEHDLATIVELSPDTLTAQGKRDWADVLAATVDRIYTGVYGIQADISGCDAGRLRDFSYMLAGEVSASDYDRWMTGKEEEPENDTVEVPHTPLQADHHAVGEQHETLLQALRDRINSNYTAYLEVLRGFGTSELIDMASSIAAMSDAYSYLTEWHSFDDAELEFYLQFQNPLEVVADVRSDFNADLSEMDFVLNRIGERCDEFLSAYPLMSDTDAPADATRRRFMNVDLELFLGKIAEKAIIHYPNDWNIDMDTLRRAAVSNDPDDKRLVWHVCSMGTHLQREREVYIQGSGAHVYMTDYHQNDPDMFGYCVEVVGMNGNDVIGNVFEVGNYVDFARHVTDTALPCDFVTLIYHDGSEVHLPKGQYDEDPATYNMAKGYPLPETRYHPANEADLVELLRQNRAKRMAYPLDGTGAHLQKMAATLAEVRKPTADMPPPESSAKAAPTSLGDRLRAAQVRADVYNAHTDKTQTSKQER